MREDYSADGDAWVHFDHDQARARVYRWNEDGLAGLCDAQQRLCLALALWNGRDPFLKERAFGLTGHQGNRGEHAKASCPQTRPINHPTPAASGLRGPAAPIRPHSPARRRRWA